METEVQFLKIFTTLWLLKAGKLNYYNNVLYSKLRKILKELILLDEQIISNGGEPRKSIFSPDKPIEINNGKQEENKGKLQ